MPGPDSDMIPTKSPLLTGKTGSKNLVSRQKKKWRAISLMLLLNTRMLRFTTLILLSVLALRSFGQELNCKVTINADQIQTSDRSVFKDMERAFANFLNTRKWTTDNLKNYEKINCSLFLNIKMPSIGNFVANAQITSARPIYNTNYETVVFNFADREWEFG